MVKRDFKIMCIQILWEKIGKVNFSVFLRILSLPPTPAQNRLSQSFTLGPRFKKKKVFFSHSYRLINC